MTQVIELTKKQLEMISSTQKQKADLQKAFGEIAQKEAVIVDLILDSNGVTEQPKDIRFENETLVLTFAEPEAKKTKTKKAKAKVAEDTYNQG